MHVMEGIEMGWRLTTSEEDTHSYILKIEVSLFSQGDERVVQDRMDDWK